MRVGIQFKVEARCMLNNTKSLRAALDPAWDLETDSAIYQKIQIMTEVLAIS